MLFICRFRLICLKSCVLLVLLQGTADANPIVGGHTVQPPSNYGDAVLAKYPYMVSMQDRLTTGTTNNNNNNSSSMDVVVYQHFCGGSLFHSSWILTAEHCMRHKDTEHVVAVVGCFEDISNVPLHERRVIERVEFFQNRDVVNDIALVRLLNAVELPESAYAKLPAPGMKVNRRNACRIIGYGATHYGGKVQNQLIEGEVHVITKRVCRQALGVWAPTYHDPTVCALGNDQDTCQGDSGGPLLCGHDGATYVIGIVSHGPTCGMSGVPSIYTVVFPFLDWIYTTINTQN